VEPLGIIEISDCNMCGISEVYFLLCPCNVTKLLYQWINRPHRKIAHLVHWHSDVTALPLQDKW